MSRRVILPTSRRLGSPPLANVAPLGTAQYRPFDNPHAGLGSKGDQNRRRVPRVPPRRTQGLDRRRTRRRRSQPPRLQADRERQGEDLRPCARSRDARHHVLRRPHDRRAMPDRRQTTRDEGRLARKANRGRHGHRRPGRDRDPRGRRDGRRDVVALRRPRCPQRDQPRVLRTYPQPRATGGGCRPVPRIGQHRPEGRSHAASTRARPRRPPARRQGDQQRARRARREVRDSRGVRQPGIRQADDRRLGRRRAIGLRDRLRRRHGCAWRQAHLSIVVRGSRVLIGLSAFEPLRRDRLNDRLRRRRGSLGERPLLSTYTSRRVHTCDAASLQHPPLRPTAPALRRPPDRRRIHHCNPDGRQDAPGRAREARPSSSVIARASTPI